MVLFSNFLQSGRKLRLRFRGSYMAPSAKARDSWSWGWWVQAPHWAERLLGKKKRKRKRKETGPLFALECHLYKRWCCPRTGWAAVRLGRHRNRLFLRARNSGSVAFFPALFALGISPLQAACFPNWPLLTQQRALRVCVLNGKLTHSCLSDPFWLN